MQVVQSYHVQNSSQNVAPLPQGHEKVETILVFETLSHRSYEEEQPNPCQTTDPQELVRPLQNTGESERF